jgi:hypothetical protein
MKMDLYDYLNGRKMGEYSEVSAKIPGFDVANLGFNDGTGGIGDAR